MTRPPPIVLHDPDDDRLADYRLLDHQAARRRREGDEYFIAEGYLAIDRVLDSGHRLRSVLVQPSRVERLLEREIPTDVPVFVLDGASMAEAVGFDLHRGVLASAWRGPTPTTSDVATSAERVAVLEGLNDPENVGVIARAARALGFDALVLDPTCTDPYARRTIRVSMGEILHLPVARSRRWPDDLGVLHDAGFESWALTPARDADDLWRTPTPRKIAIVLGAEGPGLHSTTLEACDRRVRIPIDDRVDSLNVGHAAAIAFAVVSQPPPCDAS